MAGQGESKTSVKRLDAAEKQRQALELRKAGVGYQKIADALGYASPNGAWKAVMAGLKATLREPAEEVRNLELDRLDEMLAGIWRAALSGNPEAVDRVLKIQARRAALLGLDIGKDQTPGPQVNVAVMVNPFQLYKQALDDVGRDEIAEEMKKVEHRNGTNGHA